MRLRVWRVAPLVALLLAACGSTTTQRPSTTAPDVGLPTVTPGTAALVEPGATPQPSARVLAAPTPTPGNGPITPIMAQLQLDGERFATLGDPNAPLTMIEFSDYG